jgi:hypothetical protein
VLCRLGMVRKSAAAVQISSRTYMSQLKISNAAMLEKAFA